MQVRGLEGVTIGMRCVLAAGVRMMQPSGGTLFWTVERKADLWRGAGSVGGASHLVDGGGRVGSDRCAVPAQAELSLRAASQLASAMTPAVARHRGKPPN